ncbi:hypothetical protein ACEWY4_008669 [Coilia grayii]|uniref:SERTA domain-containing protein n=1 Tax=Coilia grayii TaxID=363190 RepID=A0ABD1KBI3_9TELE
MTAKGLKRKLPSEQEQIGPAWEHQRQSVLDISIEKYQQDLTLIEPSLRRSVLIANTLRQIQSDELQPNHNDMDVSFVIPAKTPPSPFQPSILQSNFSHQVQSFPSVADCPSLTEAGGDDWMSTSPEEEFSLSTAISSILKELDGEGIQDMSQHSLAPQRTPLGSIENLPGGLDSRPRSWWAGQRGGEERGRGFEVLSPPGGVGVGVTRTTYLHDVALDSLLLDMDMCVFDREVGSLGGRAFSVVNNEELVKYLPPLSASTSGVLPSQNAKDLHELEHIMEILVES